MKLSGMSLVRINSTKTWIANRPRNATPISAHPDPDASKACTCDQLTQPPQRDRKRGEPGGSETRIDAVRNVVAEHQLPAVPREGERAGEDRRDPGPQRRIPQHLVITVRGFWIDLNGRVSASRDV